MVYFVNVFLAQLMIGNVIVENIKEFVTEELYVNVVELKLLNPKSDDIVWDLLN